MSKSKLDTIFVFGTDVRNPVHVEMVADGATSRKQAVRRLTKAFNDADDNVIKVTTNVENDMVYIDVQPNDTTVRIHIALKPAGAADCDEVYEYDQEKKP